MKITIDNCKKMNFKMNYCVECDEYYEAINNSCRKIELSIEGCER